MNWKAACKHFYQQFRLWVKAYNQVADVYMIAESWSSGAPSYSITYLSNHEHRKIHIDYNGGRAVSQINQWIENGRTWMTPAEFAQRNRQRTLRVCTVCGPTNNKFEKEHNVCIKCRSQQKLQWQHEHPRRKR